MTKSHVAALTIAVVLGTALAELAPLLDPWSDGGELSSPVLMATAVLAFGAGWLTNKKLRLMRRR
jgi:uncharacterized membrane protein YadS